jgi:hypothetical protein
LKACLFFYDKDVKGIGGGRNFSDSDWIDCTFELSKAHIKKLYGHISEVWDASKVLDDSTIGEIFEEQEISERGFAATVAGVEIDDQDNKDIPF